MEQFSYITLVRINPSILAAELEPLWEAYKSVDPTGNLRKTKKADNMLGAEAARSAFSRVNNLQKFYDRLMSGEIPSTDNADGTKTFEVTASAKGSSTRIYFHPSVTSLSKEIRKAIVPLHDGNVFISTDLKAAEFALRCYQAGERDALAEYAKGGDIYMHFADLFPAGTDRKVIKKILIANMYGQTAYRVGLDLGITETQAQRLLDRVASALPAQTLLKRRIMDYDIKNHGYFCPDGLDLSKMVRIADIDPVKGFNPDLACSVYTQSALGLMMQKFTKTLLEHQKDVPCTFLSVFDSVVFEISEQSAERFIEFFRNRWVPLLPDEFRIGKTMYSAMYE